MAAEAHSVAAATPSISVVVLLDGTAPDQEGSLDDCLAGLEAQTLDSARYEVVLVPTSPDRPVLSVATVIRVLVLPGADPASARAAAIAACRAPQVVFVAPWQRPAPHLLEWLLATADDAVLPVAAGPRGPRPAARLESVTTGALLPRDAARSLAFEEEAREGAGALHLLSLVLRDGYRLREATPEDDARLDSTPAGAAREALDALNGVLRLKAGRERRPRRRAAVRAAATELGEVLAQYPELRPEVVSEVRRRGLAQLPWDLVNRGHARQLGLLYCFPPAIDTSGLVAARRLEELGLVTDVVTQDRSNRRPVSESSVQLAAPYLDELRVLPGARSFGAWRAVRGWTEEALRHVEELEAAHGPYDQLYSRAMGVHSHFAAAVVKLRRPELRWVAEFSDPMAYDELGRLRERQAQQDWLSEELQRGMRRRGHALPATRRHFEWSELLAYALADEVVFTNANQREVMLGRCSDPALAERARSVSRVSHHPVPPPESYELSRARLDLHPGKVHLGYFGTFYLNRGLHEVVDALASLSGAERDRLQLHVFTNRSGVELEVIEMGVADVITVNPLVPYFDYLRLTTQFDALVLSDYATAEHTRPNPFLPAKLAEYLGSGRPLWAIVEEGSVLSEVPTAYRTRVGDVAGARDVLRKLVRGLPAGGGSTGSLRG